MDKNSLAHTRWECKYHIVFASKYTQNHLNRDRILTKIYHWSIMIVIYKKSIMKGE